MQMTVMILFNTINTESEKQDILNVNLVSGAGKGATSGERNKKTRVKSNTKLNPVTSQHISTGPAAIIWSQRWPTKTLRQ